MNRALARRLIVAALPAAGLGCAAAPRTTLGALARHDFPYVSRYVDVLGSRIHYVEAGRGAPIVLVHGQPTWSYIWRSVMPRLEQSGRVIAVDLIGFGKSGRPAIQYTLEDHASYFRAFLEALNLRDITFVLHDWGSWLGFQYAADYPDNVASLVFMEAILPPDFMRPVPGSPRYTDALLFFETARTLADTTRRALADSLIRRENVWLEQVLPRNVMRSLGADELNAYREPFQRPDDRLPMLQLPRALRSRYAINEVLRYSDFLQRSTHPKLAFVVHPGVTSTTQSVAWLEANLKELTLVNLGPGLHYVQEDYGDRIGRLTTAWLATVRAVR